MRTRPNSNDDDKHVETVGNRPVENIPDTGVTDALAKNIGESSLMDPPRGLEVTGAQPVTTSKRYRVLADKPISSNGFRTTLRAGKVVDESNYSIASLKSQGVQLQEIE